MSLVAFGNTTLEAGATGFSLGKFLGGLFTGGPTGRPLRSIWVGAHSNSGNQNMQLGVYDSSGNLIGNTSTFTVTTTSGWFGGTASGTLDDPNGEYYIVGIAQLGNDVSLQTSASGGLGAFQSGSGQSFGTWPSTLSLSLAGTHVLTSLYLVYDPGTFLDWLGVLNALAGTSGLDVVGAANVWAGLTPGTLSLLGALNYKNGWRSGGTKPYLDLTGVCNAIAGTSGLEPLGALNALNGATL